jgi:hypothetical protein
VGARVKVARAWSCIASLKCFQILIQSHLRLK